MRAVSKDGFALRFASQELKGDKEMMQHALRPRPGQGDLIGLKVVLLSGRCCDEIFLFHCEGRSRVLRRCAELLDLEPDHVERSGALMRGAVEVQERQIPGGRFKHFLSRFGAKGGGVRESGRGLGFIENRVRGGCIRGGGGGRCGTGAGRMAAGRGGCTSMLRPVAQVTRLCVCIAFWRQAQWI